VLTTSQPVLGRTLGQCIEGKGLVRMEVMEVVSYFTDYVHCHNEGWLLEVIYNSFSVSGFEAGILRYSNCNMSNRTYLCPYLGTVHGMRKVWPGS